MHGSLQQLNEIYTDCAAYADSMASSSAADVSEFWREHLSDDKRRNYPSFDEMLVMRRGFTYPLADRAKVSDRDQERAYAEGAWSVITRSMPADWFDRFEESALGSPVAFPLDGHTLTAGGIVNALTASRIAHWCERAGLTGRPLRVLEIGAGYGQAAHQLLQVLDVETWAVCDLPENLFLGAFYLRGNFPERSAAFIDGSGAPKAEFLFTVPPFLDSLEGPYDLIINSYSFQEMNRESVDTYFEHAGRTLADGGIFYSLNAHAKAGIERPSEYRVDRFELESMLPVRRFPWQAFATNPYELVMRPRAGAAPAGEELDALHERLDALGYAFQLGLHDELLPLCESADRETLQALLRYFEADTASDKIEAAGALTELPAVSGYLRGLVEFAAGRDEEAEAALAGAVPGLGETHARVLALACLAALAAGRGDEEGSSRLRAEAATLAPHLGAELDGLVAEPASLAAAVAAQVSLPHEPQAPRRLLGRLRGALPAR